MKAMAGRYQRAIGPRVRADAERAACVVVIAAAVARPRGVGLKGRGGWTRAAVLKGRKRRRRGAGILRVMGIDFGTVGGM
jgi:hypothetical protein